MKMNFASSLNSPRAFNPVFDRSCYKLSIPCITSVYKIADAFKGVFLLFLSLILYLYWKCHYDERVE